LQSHRRQSGSTANQLWPDLPQATLFNDIAIALFVLDVFLVIIGWPTTFPDESFAETSCSQRLASIPPLCGLETQIQSQTPDFKADVRSLSFSVDLTRNGTAVPDGNGGRQDFSLQNATTLPINDSPAFLALMKVLTASNPAAGLLTLPLRDKLRVLRTLVLVQLQARQKIKPYQQLRYWSNVPFRHGPIDVVKQSAIPFPDNPARSLQRTNPNAMQDELIRHLTEDRRNEWVRLWTPVARPQ
jgi:hypothetical protein